MGRCGENCKSTVPFLLKPFYIMLPFVSGDLGLACNTCGSKIEWKMLVPSLKHGQSAKNISASAFSNRHHTTWPGGPGGIMIHFIHAKSENPKRRLGPSAVRRPFGDVAMPRLRSGDPVIMDPRDAMEAGPPWDQWDISPIEVQFNRFFF